MAEALLALQGISKRFSGVKALDNVSFDVRPGEVHVLVGENGAGKSTLMKIINGIYKADSGKMIYCGVETEVSSPREAQEKGIAMIHQELNNIPDMMVAENLFLGREPARRGIVDRKKMYLETEKLLQPINLKIDPRTKMRELSVAQMQMVEIAKAISYNSKIIIMDEPTSAISDQEVETLFGIINMLRNHNVGIVYISHKMDEVFRIADRITVLRDGVTVGTYNTEELNRDRLITLMVGRKLTDIYPPKTKRLDDRVLMKVLNLTSDAVKSISFELHAGEVLGIGGLMGSGRSELLESIYGLRKCTSGTLEIDGKRINISCPSEAISNSLAFVTEDRVRTGLNLKTTIKRDMSIVTLAKFCWHGIIQRKKENAAVDLAIRQLNVKTPHRNQLVVNLSGGNQQKVILARWLMSEPKIILLNEPTRGIDVGAKYEIYTIIQQMAAAGKGVLVVSSELPELIGICDRVLMMCEGVMTGELFGDTLTQEEMMKLATKEKSKG